MLRFFIPALLLAFPASTFADTRIEVPETTKFLDQQEIHEFGCGPVSLLNAYRLSTQQWRHAASSKLPRVDEVKQFNYLTRRFGFRRSRSVYGHKRWNDQSGMQVLDLRDLANDFHKVCKLPKLSHASLFLMKDESFDDLITRSHQRITTSLNNGFTPILNLSRFSREKMRRGSYRWAKSHSHFVTVIGVSDIENQQFTIDYIDPWGGRKLQGVIQQAEKLFFASDITSGTYKGLRKTPTLEAKCPHSNVGIHLLKSGTPNTLVPDHIIYAKESP